MRNINKIEREFLIEQKLREGKSVMEASQEVNRDMEFIKDLNEQKKRLTKDIKDLEKEKTKTSKQFKKEFKKITTKEPKETKTSYSKSATTKHLSRILNYLGEYPKSNITNIARESLMNTGQAKDGLMFLLRNNHVIKERMKETKVYSLVIKIEDKS